MESRWRPACWVGSACLVAALSACDLAPRRVVLRLEPTPLADAVLAGDWATAEKLLADGYDVNERNEQGQTPLHHVAASGSKEMVQFLIDHGGDVDALDHYRYTPLHRAVLEGSPEAVEALLGAGPDLRITHNRPAHLFFVAAYRRRKEVMEVLVRSFGASLPVAAALDRTKEVRAMLAKGADAEQSYMDAFTALHYAARCWAGRDTVQALVDAGADVNARADERETPLHMAVRSGNREAARGLVANGAQVMARNEDGRTPLHEAALAGFADLTSFLIDSGADVNARDRFGETPLHSAALMGRVAAGRLLLAHGADPAPMNRSGSTPLGRAERLEHHAFVKLLLDAGADE